MDKERYNLIKEFMNGRDISSSYSDPKHNSEYDFSEFEHVYNEEQKLIEPVEIKEDII
jgi:hypothetical protein